MRTLRSLLKDPRMRSSRSAALRGGAVRRTLATRTSHSLSQGLGFRQQRPALSGTCLRHVKQPDKHGGNTYLYTGILGSWTKQAELAPSGVNVTSIASIYNSAGFMEYGKNCNGGGEYCQYEVWFTTSNAGNNNIYLWQGG